MNGCKFAQLMVATVCQFVAILSINGCNFVAINGCNCVALNGCNFVLIHCCNFVSIDGWDCVN